MLSVNTNSGIAAQIAQQSSTSEQSASESKSDISTCIDNAHISLPISTASASSQFSMNSLPECANRLFNINNSQQTQALLKAAPLAVGHPREKAFPWAQAQDLYMTQSQLADNITKKPLDGSKILVIDVRDEDAIGGQVSGALHISDTHLGQPMVLACLATKALNLGPQSTVVFHCMESLRRGPRCAQRLTKIFDLVDTDNKKPLERPKIRVLEGGADHWIRSFWNTNLVENYDDKYWGLTDIKYDQTNPLMIEHSHALYEKPQDDLFQKAKM